MASENEAAAATRQPVATNQGKNLLKTAIILTCAKLSNNLRMCNLRHWPAMINVRRHNRIANRSMSGGGHAFQSRMLLDFGPSIVALNLRLPLHAKRLDL
jgi:hypothetical protein